MCARIVTAGAAAGIVIVAAVIAMSGGMVRAPTLRHAPSSTPGVDRTDPKAMDSARPVRTSPQNAPEPEGVSPASPEEPERAGQLDPQGGSSSTSPPKAKSPEDWKATTLFNPVATAAGLIEAKGYTVAVKGIEPVPPDETCSFEGRDWPCGLRARSAFRAWLRGRAVTCVVPAEPERDTIVTICTVGKQDIGAWLAAGGWSRPQGDAYAELASAAAKSAKGIFGAPGTKEAPTYSIVGSTLPSPGGAGAILAPNAARQDEVFPPKPPAPSPSIVTLPAAPTAPAQ